MQIQVVVDHSADKKNLPDVIKSDFTTKKDHYYKVIALGNKT